MWLGKAFGRLAAVLSSQRRIIARKNIELCFPELSEEEKRALFWKTMESTGKGFFDAGIAWFWPYWRMRRVLDVSGVEKLAEAYEQGQGVVVFMYHFTSLEISLASLNRNYSQTVYGVYRPNKNIVYDFVMRLGRERHGEKKIALPRNDVRGMVRALRKGNLIIYLPDQDYGHQHSTFVPFFNIETATLVAPTRLVKMSGAKVFSFCTIRKDDGSGYEIRLHPEMEGYGQQGDEEADALRVNQFIEARVREHPDQYLWVHRRFKSRPDHEKDFYGLKSLKSFQRRQKRRAKNRQKRDAQK